MEQQNAQHLTDCLTAMEVRVGNVTQMPPIQVVILQMRKDVIGVNGPILLVVVLAQRDGGTSHTTIRVRIITVFAKMAIQMGTWCLEIVL